MKQRSTLLAGFVSAALLAACSSNEGTDPGSGTDVPVGERKLKTLDSAEAFVDTLRAGLIGQVSDRYLVGGVAVDSDTPTSSPTVSGPPGAENGGTSSESAGSTDDLSSNEVTGTNVQEQGVDEQDWVKLASDGNRLYVLDRGYQDYGFPIGAVAVDLPAESGGGVADGDTADILPSPQPSASTLRILALDVDSPDSSSLKELTLELDGRYAEGFYLYETAEQSQVVVTSSGNSFWAYWSQPAAFGGLDSQITRIDVSDPASAVVNGSVSFDGQIVSSRRIGKYLFFASRFYPSLPGVQPYEVTPDEWRQAVNAADAADLLPQFRRDDGSAAEPLFDPAGCFVADAGENDDYYSPDVITLAVLDLDSMQLTDSACYLGATETLYASPEAVFLATTRYDYSAGPVTEEGTVIDIEVGVIRPDIAWHDPRVDTDIHQFDIDAGTLNYVGSGTVPGHLGWNELRKPFRMSEKDGYLRVTTMNDRQGLDHSPILVTVLQANGAGELKTVATLPNPSQPGFIGKPGEQLYASRFLGDRAYLVTFRQTDPLYVIDLADPAQPRVAGELNINGYSDYLHPIGQDYLLGIGKDAVPAPDNIGDGGGALAQGIKISLFDVSNPSSPRELQSVLAGQRGTEARALADHRAITVQAATDEHPTRVSFGIDIAGQASPGSSPSGDAAFNYYPWNYSGLHAYDIRTGADAGITPRGALVVERASGNPYGYPAHTEDRSVMVNDSVFYIRGSQVYAAPWDDLGNPSPAR